MPSAPWQLEQLATSGGAAKAGAPNMASQTMAAAAIFPGAEQVGEFTVYLRRRVGPFYRADRFQIPTESAASQARSRCSVKTCD
jgi:hypothetical protein